MKIDYLPSLVGPISCYYKPVTCESPPKVTDARIVNRTEDYRIYKAMSQVEFECADETFQMEGNNTVICLYSGEWSTITKVCDKEICKFESFEYCVATVVNTFVFTHNNTCIKEICLCRDKNCSISQKSKGI